MNNRGKGDFRCDRLRETEHSVLALQKRSSIRLDKAT